MSLINNLSGKYSMPKTSFCEISDLYLRYLRDEACHITTFQKEKCVRLNALSELSFAGGWPGQSTFHFSTIGMAMKGAPSTLVVCVCGGGGGTGCSEVGTTSSSASVFTVRGTSVSAEGVTLFSEGLGTGHHGGGHLSYIVGVWAPCERYGAWGVISVSSEPKPGDILDTG